MTTVYHTPHSFGAPLTSSEVNAPLGQLDAAIGALNGQWVVVNCTADGVTDNAARIQAAATAATFGMPIVILSSNPAQKIGIGSTVTFAKQGTRLIGINRGAGNATGTIFVALGNFGAGSMFEWKTALTTDTHEGIGAENFNIDMAGFTGHGITVYRGYNAAYFANVRIRNVADAYSAWRFMPQPTAGSSDRVSQGITCVNLWGQHQNDTSTAPAFYIENLQECVFIACKGWGGAGTAAAGNWPYTLVDCRGVQFYGCSAAASAKGGWNVTVARRNSTNVTIDAPTFELLGSGGTGNYIRTGAPEGTATYNAGTAYVVNDVVVYPAAGAAYVCIQAGTNHQPDISATFWTPISITQLSQRNPRYQTPVSSFYSLDQLSNCTLETGSQTVTFSDNCTQNHVVSSRPDLVSLGLGLGNSVFGTSYFQSGKLYAPTFRVTSSLTNVTSALYLGATLILTGTGSPAGVVVANPGSLFLRTDGGAGTTLYVKETLTTSAGWVAK